MKKLFTLSNLIPLILVVYLIKSFIVTPGFFDFGVILLMSIGFNIKLKLEKEMFSDRDYILEKIDKLEDKYKEDFKVISDVTDHKIKDIGDQVSRNTLGLGLNPNSIKETFGRKQR